MFRVKNMSVIIKGPSRQQNVSFLNTIDDDNGVTVNPGDVITADSDFMRGHGTYQEMCFTVYFWFCGKDPHLKLFHLTNSGIFLKLVHCSKRSRCFLEISPVLKLQCFIGVSS